MVRKHYLVSGRVQGVGFRNFVFKQASQLGLHGRVRNLRDGRVELEAQGVPEMLRKLEAAIAQGPTHANVTDVETKTLTEDEGLKKDFSVLEDGDSPW